MKKMFLGIIIGLILAYGFAYATDILLPAASIGYESEYTEKTNVADALDELLISTSNSLAPLVWTNPNPSNSLSGWITFDKEAPADTKYFLIMFQSSFSGNVDKDYAVIEHNNVNNPNNTDFHAFGHLGDAGGVSSARRVYQSTLTSMQFSSATYYNQNSANSYSVPVKIWAITFDWE